MLMNNQSQISSSFLPDSEIDAFYCSATYLPLWEVKDTSIESTIIAGSGFDDLTRGNVPQTSKAPKNRTLCNSNIQSGNRAS